MLRIIRQINQVNKIIANAKKEEISEKAFAIKLRLQNKLRGKYLSTPEQRAQHKNILHLILKHFSIEEKQITQFYV